MNGYMWCHYCNEERLPTSLDYSGYCVHCGTKAVAYAKNGGPLAKTELTVDVEVLEALTMDGEAVPLDKRRSINWHRRMTLAQMIGGTDKPETCGTCLYGTKITDVIISCPISQNRGATLHMNGHTPACRAYVPKPKQ